MAEELEMWRVALSWEMDVGFRKGSPGHVGEERRQDGLSCCRLCPSVHCHHHSMHPGVCMEAALLGTVYPGVSGPSEPSEGRGGNSRLQRAAPCGVRERTGQLFTRGAVRSSLWGLAGRLVSRLLPSHPADGPVTPLGLGLQLLLSLSRWMGRDKADSDLVVAIDRRRHPV